jgi:integrase
VQSVRGRSRPTLLPCARLSTIAGGAAWTRSFHTRRFAAAVAAARLDPDTTFHALRHSYISRALKAGVPAKAVAVHCGTSLAMIARHYSKFLAEDRKRYAAIAAPPLRLELTGDKVSPLRAGDSGW